MRLVEFLLARIAEDERAARAVPEGIGVADGLLSTAQAEAANAFMDRAQPARILADCEAKRRIVELWAEEWPDWHGKGSGLVRTRMTADRFGHLLVAERVLGYLALPFAAHPDYDPEWKPT